MAPKPSVAVVSPFIDREHGTERALAEQLERLAKSYEIELFSEKARDLDFSAIHWHRVFVPPAPQILHFAWWFFANGLSRRSYFRKARTRPELLYSPGINCFGADVVWVHIVFEELRESLRESRAGDWPSSSWLRQLHRGAYYRLIASLENRIYGRERNVLVVPSKRVAAAIERHFGRSNGIEVVYHGVDVNRFQASARLALRGAARRTLGFSEADIVVLLIGNHWRTKGLPALIEAVGSSSNLSLRILAAGEDDPGAYKDLAAARNLSDRIVFAPVRPDVEFYYAAADIYAGPSLEDAFALPPLEAMACGLPVITSRNAGVSELVHPGVDGFVLEDPTDAAQLSQLLARLAADANLRAAIGEAAAATAAKYTWDENAARLNEIFERVLLERSASQGPYAGKLEPSA